MRRTVILAASTAMLVAAAPRNAPLAAPRTAPLAAATRAAYVSVANVDVMPSRTADGDRILGDYAARAGHDPGVASVVLLRQDGLPNHFILVQRFADRAQVDAHAEAAYVRRFRATLFPVLGSPYDERLERDVTNETSQIAKPPSASAVPTSPVDDHP